MTLILWKLCKSELTYLLRETTQESETGEQICKVGLTTFEHECSNELHAAGLKQADKSVCSLNLVRSRGATRRAVVDVMKRHREQAVVDVRRPEWGDFLTTVTMMLFKQAGLLIMFIYCISNQLRKAAIPKVSHASWKLASTFETFRS